MEKNDGTKASPVRLQDKQCKGGGRECGTVDERAKQRMVARRKFRSSCSSCDVEVHSIPTRRPIYSICEIYAYVNRKGCIVTRRAASTVQKCRMTGHCLPARTALVS